MRQTPILVTLVTALAVGCAPVPNPKGAVADYADAAARGDADAIYDMMSEKGKKSLTREDVRRIVQDQRAELADLGKAVTAPGVVVRSRARVHYADGEDASLDLEDGGFRVTGTDALPSGARAPEQALEQLRRVLARRSYPGLLRILSPSTRSAIEADMRSLVSGLEHPEGLEVNTVGDRATVRVPGGHEVKLRREAGVWYVDDFD